MSSVDPQGMSVRLLKTQTLPQLSRSPNQVPVQATYFSMPMKDEFDNRLLQDLKPGAFNEPQSGPVSKPQYQIMTKLHSGISWGQVIEAGDSLARFAKIQKGMFIGDANKARKLNSTEAKYLAWRILTNQPGTTDLADSDKIQYLSSLVFLLANQQEAEAAKKKKA